MKNPWKWNYYDKFTFSIYQKYLKWNYKKTPPNFRVVKMPALTVSLYITGYWCLDCRGWGAGIEGVYPQRCEAETSGWHSESKICKKKYGPQCGGGPGRALMLHEMQDWVSQQEAEKTCCFNAGPTSATLAQHWNSIETAIGIWGNPADLETVCDPGEGISEGITAWWLATGGIYWLIPHPSSAQCWIKLWLNRLNGGDPRWKE